MTGWALKILGGQFGGIILAALAALILTLAGTILVQRAANADLRAEAVSCAGAKDRLQAAIESQNLEVERLRSEAKRAAEAADLLALRELNRIHTPPPAGSGPDELNRWFAQRLRPQR